MGKGSRGALGALGVVGLMSLAEDAGAASGDGVGLGPVVGITWRGSVSLGWELSGSYRSPLLRLATGGSYQPWRAEGDPKSVHYLAWEPWLFAGATVGLAVTDELEGRFLYGLWAAYAQDLGDPLFDSELDFVDDDVGYQWVLSLSIGWRGIGGTQQFYLAPKLYRYQGFDFFT